VKIKDFEKKVRDRNGITVVIQARRTDNKARRDLEEGGANRGFLSQGPHEGDLLDIDPSRRIGRLDRNRSGRSRRSPGPQKRPRKRFLASEAAFTRHDVLVSS
jgi:hypothetical protein